jgi:carbon monoxide dehydrogenase subunit G
MRFQGDVTIDAPRERAWAFLTDAGEVTQCAPGVQSLKIVDDRRFMVDVRAGVGPIRGTFTCAVMWLERHAPERVRVQARCKVPASTVDVMTVLALSDLGDGRSLLHWESDVRLSGLLGGLSGPLIRGAADAVLRETFACINAKLSGPSPSTSAV